MVDKSANALTAWLQRALKMGESSGRRRGAFES